MEAAALRLLRASLIGTLVENLAKTSLINIFDPMKHDGSCGNSFAGRGKGIEPVASRNDTTNVQKNVSNVILSRKPKEKNWSLLVKIVAPAEIVSLIILVGFIHTRSGVQSNAEEPPPKSNNFETSPSYEDNAN